MGRATGARVRRSTLALALVTLLAISTFIGSTAIQSAAAAAEPVNCPCTLFSSTSRPTNPDISASQDPAAATYGVELGVKFSSDITGWVTAVRFYKGGADNGGTHVAHLWTSAGTLLATATFVNETPSGWQQVTLPAPVHVTAGVIYVASYLAPQGHYAGDNDSFSSSVDAAPLHAPSSAAAGGNGVFAYQKPFGPGGFPSDTYRATNYWVDVVLSRQCPPPCLGQ